MPRGAVPFPFGQCRVCNAQATGNHYGANTCEGCKGFFKRSLGKSDKYKCLNNEKCAIEPENRIKCKLCRFKRCLELGMSMNAIKMGRIPKVQKQKALDVEKAGQDSTTDMPFIDSRDMYRNNNLQSSPPLNEQDIEPPKCKQLKSCDSNSSMSATGREQMMTSIYQEPAADGTYSNPSKLSHPMDTHDMVQLLHDVISIDNERANHNGSHKQVLPQQQLSSDDYARTLASVNSIHSAPCNSWHSKANGSNYRAAVLKHDYVGEENAFGVHSDYDFTADRMYEQRALDAYANDCHNISYTHTRDVHSPSHNSPHALPSPPVISAPPSVYHSDRTAVHGNHRFAANDNSGYYSQVTDPLGSYDGRSPGYQYSPCHTQKDTHSDYGSVEEVSPPYRSTTMGTVAAADGSDALIKSITNVYWRLTQDVRDAVAVMEEIIASGSTHIFLPLCKENLPTLWKLLMDSVVHYNNLMTKFCIMCPLISNSCSPEDKKTLIQHSYISVWLVWNSPVIKNGQSYIPFCNSNTFVYSRNWMQKILPVDFVEYIHEYTARQNSARLSVSEIALLSCLALTPSDVPGVNNPGVVNHLHQQFMQLLTREICKTRVNPKEMLNEILHLLKLLKVAVVKQRVILQFDHHNPPDIEFD